MELSPRERGSLLVVGTGINVAGHMTSEARHAIAGAEKLFYLVAERATVENLLSLNPTAESLHDSYRDGKQRLDAYREMVERILTPVRAGQRVCAAFYGHPGVFAFPPHEAIRQARREGFQAQMLPGVSAEDCLFADLGVDPSMTGCQSFEATDFLVHKRIFDPSSCLILWQVGVLGDLTFRSSGYGSPHLQVLAQYLAPIYGDEHRIILYEAAHLPIFEARMDPIRIKELPEVEVSAITTMYIPPAKQAKLDPEMLAKLGLKDSDIARVEVRLPTADA